MLDATLNIGAAVHCRDGRAGTLAKVVVDPQSKRVTNLIVEKGHLQKKDRVLPVETIELATAEAISLNIRCSELKNYPEYREVEFSLPAEGWSHDVYPREDVLHWITVYDPAIVGGLSVPRVRQVARIGIDERQKVIERGMPIFNINGMFAKVDHLLVDPATGEITHVIARKGLLPNQLIIPFTAVEEIGEKGLYIHKTNDELKETAHYIPRLPLDILRELQQRLEESMSKFQHVRLELKEGVMHLTGYVKNETIRQEAEEIARSVRGVVEVKNLLRTGTGIEEEIQEAIQEDTRTEGEAIDVAFHQGVVTLSGHVSRSASRQAAQEIAAQNEHVAAVVNELEVESVEEEQKTPVG